jgi:hypothetical protein
MNRPLRVLSWKGAWGEALLHGVSRPFQDATQIAVEAVPHVGLPLPEALTRALDGHGILTRATWDNDRH